MANSNVLDLYANVLADLKSQFPGAMVLYPVDLGKILKNTLKAVEHLIARGKLPFPVKKLGGKNCVSLHDVAAWLAEDSRPEPLPESKPKKQGQDTDGKRRGPAQTRGTRWGASLGPKIHGLISRTLWSWGDAAASEAEREFLHDLSHEYALWSIGFYEIDPLKTTT